MWKAERAIRAYDKLRREMGEEGAKRAIEKAQRELERETRRPASWEDAVLHLARERIVEAMEWEVHLPADRVSLLLLNYLKDHRPVNSMKVIDFSEPSYIEGKFGSLFGYDAKGIVKINILSENGKSKIRLNLSFKRYLIGGGLAVALGAPALLLLILWLIARIPLTAYESLLFFVLTIPAAVLTFLFWGVFICMDRTQERVIKGISGFLTGLERA